MHHATSFIVILSLIVYVIVILWRGKRIYEALFAIYSLGNESTDYVPQ